MALLLNVCVVGELLCWLCPVGALAARDICAAEGELCLQEDVCLHNGFCLVSVVLTYDGTNRKLDIQRGVYPVSLRVFLGKCM